MSRDYKHESLSPEGESRRESILREVSAQLPSIATKRKRRRRAAVGGSALALVFVVSAAVVMVLNLLVAPPIAPQVVEAPTETVEPLIDFAVIPTSDEIDPSVYVRTDLDAINAMVRKRGLILNGFMVQISVQGGCGPLMSGVKQRRMNP